MRNEERLNNDLTLNLFGLVKVSSVISFCAVIRHNVTEVKKIPRILTVKFLARDEPSTQYIPIIYRSCSLWLPHV